MFLLVSLALAAAAPASAAPPPAPATKVQVDPAAKAAALNLARFLYSEESQVATTERMVDVDMAAAFRGNKDFQDLEAHYPGFINSVLAELKPILVRYTRRDLPSYYDRVANLFASQLNASEIADLTHFYMSPTGQKLLHGMQANATAKSMIAEAVSGPDKPTSFGAITADQKAAADATKKLVDKSDEAPLLDFVSKPYFTRVAALGPQMRKLEQDFANEPDPQFEAEIEAVVKATIVRLAAAKKK